METVSPHHPLTLARCLALGLLLAAGCVPQSFDPTFDRAAHAPPNAAQPIVGAWQGEWVSEDDAAAGPARLVVAADAAGSDTLTLELVGFPTSDVGQRFNAEAAIDPRAGPVRDFTAKVPVIVVEGGLCAAALGLQAHVDGDVMRIDYWVNDAVQQVDAGRIDLRRAGRPAAATRP